MTNVIKFPMAADAGRHAGPRLLAERVPHCHAVQFYEEADFLFDTVGTFLAAGLGDGDRVLAIMASAHRDGIVRRMEGCGVDQALASGQLVLLDAHETLSKFMIGDMPDRDLFQGVLGALIAQMSTNHPRARIRAYGEMVDVLWRDGNAKAAIRLEELWTDAGREHTFTLLCAYLMGNFLKQSEASFLEVCRSHSHVLPTESFQSLDDANARLREISILQQRAQTMQRELAHRKELELALRDALRERGSIEEELRASVQRERQARERAEANDAFKDIFLGILGHDLRNPLSAILTTARLMTMRGDLAAKNHERLDRIVTSGVRMQRMIEQLLDVTSIRLSNGLPIALSERETDLLPLVSKIVGETRAANPTRGIDFQSDGPCLARVDADRFEQVVSNVLGNAVIHGHPEKPICVILSGQGHLPSLSVHNHGTPIDPAFLPHIFDPFKRGAKRGAGAQGLGLGLYISERIMSAHGGKIRVESSQETGTRFEVVFPSAPPS